VCLDIVERPAVPTSAFAFWPKIQGVAFNERKVHLYHEVRRRVLSAVYRDGLDVLHAVGAIKPHLILDDGASDIESLVPDHVDFARAGEALIVSLDGFEGKLTFVIANGGGDVAPRFQHLTHGQNALGFPFIVR
jgi:hypothetical protein